jgi:hypothetical protein
MPMSYVTTVDEKIELIREIFSSLIGAEFRGYELAQMWCSDEEEWSNWMDVPLFLSFDESTLSISWEKFDDLSIENGRVLPFSLGGSTVRWLCEGVELLDSIIGQKILGVSLAKGQMTLGNSDIEIWTRLLIELNSGATLEIFNALDENGIEVHANGFKETARKCI